MILLEIDPWTSKAEIMPRLQEILSKVESNAIDLDGALAELELIQTDVIMRAKISTTTPREAYEWQFLLLTVGNTIEFLKELS